MTTMTPQLLRTISADRARDGEKPRAAHPMPARRRSSAGRGGIGIVGAASTILAVTLFLGALPSMAGVTVSPSQPGPMPAPSPAAATPVSATGAR